MYRIKFPSLSNLLFIIAILLVCFNTNPVLAQSALPAKTTSLTLRANDIKTGFIWKSDTVNAVAEPYAALLIPVKLPNCPKQFYMQFDLGAPQTILYLPKINTIKQKYPASVGSVDSATLTNQPLIIGGTAILGNSINLKTYSSSAINWKSKHSIDIIGTLGMDILQNKTIAINYPKKSIFIGSTTPNQLASKLTLTNFMLIQNSILLPVTLMGKRTMLFFDTGSSAFELLVDREAALKMTKANDQPLQYQVNSWGRTMTANTYTTADSLIIASQTLPIKRVTYMDGASDSQIGRMMKLGIGGMTGNKLFINYILVINTVTKQFGVVKP